MRTVSIVGVGNVGGSYALALDSAGYKVLSLVSRDLDKAQKIAGRIKPRPFVSDEPDKKTASAEIIFVTTQDSGIQGAANQIASIGAAHQGFAFHASGALNSSELDSIKASGRETGSIHPLISINDPDRGAESFQSAFFALEGSDNAVDEGKLLVKALGGRSFEVRSKNKSLYHAAAVVACGHLVALINTSRRMLLEAGLEPETARDVLDPLIESTVANLAGSESHSALTGPFARADLKTIQMHLHKIEEIADKDISEVYRLLGRISLDLAGEKGLSGTESEAIRKLILLDKSNPK